MRYIIDHDIHIHSQVSPCSRDARQTKEAILAYGITNQYRLVGVTDHLWPDTREHLWPSLQNLPQADSCRFLAGTEVDMDMHGNLLISPQEMEQVDYFILALTHLHLLGCVTDPLKAPLSVEDTAVYLKERLYRAFAMDLPFERMGLAHITHIPQPKGHDITECLALFDDNEWKDIFENVARRGMGVELNFNPFALNDKQLEAILHPYRIAKEVGCKFYLGGDAHHPETFGENLKKFNKIIDLLDLHEKDKWDFIIKQRA